MPVFVIMAIKYIKGLVKKSAMNFVDGEKEIHSVMSAIQI